MLRGVENSQNNLRGGGSTPKTPGQHVWALLHQQQSFLIEKRPLPDREEQERGNERPDTTTYRHVAHLWQNWLPPKAMTTLEKGENNSNVTFSLKKCPTSMDKGIVPHPCLGVQILMHIFSSNCIKKCTSVWPVVTATARQHMPYCYFGPCV